MQPVNRSTIHPTDQRTTLNKNHLRTNLSIDGSLTQQWYLRSDRKIGISFWTRGKSNAKEVSLLRTPSALPKVPFTTSKIEWSLLFLLKSLKLCPRRVDVARYPTATNNNNKYYYDSNNKQTTKNINNNNIYDNNNNIYVLYYSAIEDYLRFRNKRQNSSMSIKA